MKFTTAASLISSSALATTDALTNPDGQSLQNAIAASSHRSLASEDKQDVAALFKERRASKRQNGNVFRKLQNKLKNSKLRNEAPEDVDESDVDMDLGFFSRNLQSNVTEAEESTVIDDLVDLCAGEDEVYGFSCVCSNVDVEAYTANVVCSYDSACLDPTQNACGGYVTFCFTETYELEVTGPGQGSSQICYDVNAPMEFSYCYGLTYKSDSGSPDSCFLEIDGTECNVCEFTTSPVDPNTTCNTFDCTNVDDSIASGTVCGDDTIVSLKIEDYLIYAPLPCEGGCNICPNNGEMMNLYNAVTMITGEQYSCAQLNLAALMGYLQNVPGDLCNALPYLVGEPCECTSPVVETAAPTMADETPAEVDSDTEPIEDTAEVEDEKTMEGDESGSAALSHGLGKLTFAAGVASLFWKMIE